MFVCLIIDSTRIFTDSRQYQTVC